MEKPVELCQQPKQHQPSWTITGEETNGERTRSGRPYQRIRHQSSPVNRKGRSDNERGRIGAGPDNGIGSCFRRAQAANRFTFGNLCQHVGITMRTPIDHGGVNRTRTDRIYPNTIASICQRCGARDANDPVFPGSIGRNAT
jgi:hypothetical protein